MLEVILSTVFPELFIFMASVFAKFRNETRLSRAIMHESGSVEGSYAKNTARDAKCLLSYFIFNRHFAS